LSFFYDFVYNDSEIKRGGSFVRIIRQLLGEQTPLPVTDEFERTVLKDNFVKLRLLAPLLLLAEIIIYLFEDLFFGIGTTLLIFIVASIILTPLIWLISMRFEKMKTAIIKVIQFIYLTSLMILGIGLTLETTAAADMVHMFFLVIFGVMFVIAMRPQESFIFLLLSYLTFALLFPYFQENRTIVMITLINACIFMAVAWFQSRMQFRAHLRRYSDQMMIENKNRILEESVRRDAMTGLFSHAHIVEILQSEMRRAVKERSSLAIIYIDIDDMKEINNQLGHLAGDEVIAQVAAILRKSSRPGDLIGRYSGEEFLMVLPAASQTAAVAVSQEIRTYCLVADFPSHIWVTLSGSIVSYAGQTLQDFLQLADDRLETAKKSGKNRFESN
jgi:diguanylate cyclase (GGDEF)-like protein